jgi:hypothetical protein
MDDCYVAHISVGWLSKERNGLKCIVSKYYDDNTKSEEEIIFGIDHADQITLLDLLDPAKEDKIQDYKKKAMFL